MQPKNSRAALSDLPAKPATLQAAAKPPSGRSIARRKNTPGPAAAPTPTSHNSGSALATTQFAHATSNSSAAGAKRRHSSGISKSLKHEPAVVHRNSHQSYGDGLDLDNDLNDEDDDDEDEDEDDDDVDSLQSTSLPKPKRQRVSIACDSCRKKKIKCDGKTPSCSTCTQYNTPCAYAQPEQKQKQKKSRVSTLSLLDARLRRIEGLLETVAPLIEQNIPQLMSLANSAVKKRSLLLKRISKHERLGNIPVDLFGRKPRNGSRNTLNDDNLDSGLSEDTSDSDSNAEEGLSEGSDNSEDERLDGDAESEDIHATNSERSSRSKSHKNSSSGASKKSNGSKSLNHLLNWPNKSIPNCPPFPMRNSSKHNGRDASNSTEEHSKKLNFKWNVPKLPNGSYIGSRFDPSKATSLDNISSVTVLNGFEQLYFEGVTFLFCSPHGFTWIAKQFRDAALYDQLESSFQTTQDGMKHLLTQIVDQSTSPMQFDKETVKRAFSAVISALGIWHIFSLDELDFLFFNEFGEYLPRNEVFQKARADQTALYQKSQGKKSDANGKSNESAAKPGEDSEEPHISSSAPHYPFETPTGINGYAEKLCVASITAIGMSIDLNDPARDDGKQTAESRKAVYELLTKYICCGIFYLERLSIAGHSVLAVKGGLFLLLLTTCSINIMPAWAMSSSVVRMAQNIGLHRKEHYEGLPSFEVCSRLHAWWLLYCLEKDVSLKFGRPSIILDSDISAPLSYDYDFDFLCKDILPSFHFLVHFVGIYRIWSRIHNELSFNISDDTSPKEQLMKVLALEKELERWKEGLPLGLQPDSPEPSSQLSMKTTFNIRNWTFKFGITYCHVIYYFCMTYLHRHVASHPSWIYRVTRVSPSEEEKAATNGSGADSSKPSPAGPSGVSNADSECDNANEVENFDTEIVSNLLREMRLDLKRGLPYKPKIRNGIKLTMRRFVMENPLLMGSPNVIVELSRKTIMSIMRLHPWNIPYIWRVSYFGFNAFLGLFISSTFMYDSEDTVTSIFYMRNLIDVFDRLFADTQGFMFQLKPNEMLRIMADGLTSYVERKRRESNMKNPEVPEIITSVKVNRDTNGQETVLYVKNNDSSNTSSPSMPSPTAMLETPNSRSAEAAAISHLKQMQQAHRQKLQQRQLAEKSTLKWPSASLSQTPSKSSPPVPSTEGMLDNILNPSPSSISEAGAAQKYQQKSLSQSSLQSPQFLSGTPEGFGTSLQTAFSTGYNMAPPLVISPQQQQPTASHTPDFQIGSTLNNGAAISSLPESTAGEQFATSAAPVFNGMSLIDPFYQGAANAATQAATTSTPAAVAAAATPLPSAADQFTGAAFMGSGTWANVDSIYNSVFGLSPLPAASVASMAAGNVAGGFNFLDFTGMVDPPQTQDQPPLDGPL